MKTLQVKWTKAFLFAASLSLPMACNNDDAPMAKGEAEFQITDAPSDDASIEGVFVTVADIKVDGKSLPTFTRQTINLKAYQEGQTAVLGSTQLDAKSYNNLVLVLDVDQDASGNAPGCYVLSTNNAKSKLGTSGTLDITMANSWDVAANSKSTIVMDFDLRKAIRATQNQTAAYQFVSSANLQAAVRLVSKGSTGTISGTYSEQAPSNANKLVVYAYKKGTFNAATETQAQGEDGILFGKAVTGAEVKDGLARSFVLTFLEEGDYELHFAAYSKAAASNQYVFQNMLLAQVAANGTTGEYVTVQSGITISISTLITGKI